MNDLGTNVCSLILGGLAGGLVGAIAGAGGVWVLLGMVTPC